MRLLLLVLVACTGLVRSSLLSAPRFGRLRGGAASDDGEAKLDDSPLSEEQVMEKLNDVPTFVVMSKEGGFVALTLQDGTRTIAFFVEPEEAKVILNMTQAAHPDVELRLACVGLGNAFKMCQESVDDGSEAKEAFSNFDGHLRLQTSGQLAKEVEPKLKAMLVATGFSEGSWQLPMFLCEQLSGGEMVPIFLNPREIRTAWEMNGQQAEDLPGKFVMLDIRMVVADMQKPGRGLPWSKVVFIGAEGAAEFANELTQLQKAQSSPQ